MTNLSGDSLRVAVALGFEMISPCADGGFDFRMPPRTGPDIFDKIWRQWFDYGDNHRCCPNRNRLPDFETDWAFGGLLIDHFKITFGMDYEPERFIAQIPGLAYEGEGPTHLIAMVRLLGSFDHT